tara:strand:+ start:57 stop:1424 length:1368 start_codon:yes stop_codon:yes gene_type:complete
MDEEKKKIDINSFFDRTEEVSGLAGKALQQTNLNTVAVQSNQTLTNNLSISIEAMKTQIRDIANYIVIENKLERKKRENEKFEVEDEKQKQEARDKALAAGEPVAKDIKRGANESEKKQGGGGGGFLGGLLKAIAIGGIVALALPLVPVIAPMLLVAMKAGIAAIGLGLIGTALVKYVPKIFSKITESFKLQQEALSNLKKNVDERINNLTSAIGAFASKKKEQVLNLSKSVNAFRKKKIGQSKDFVDNVKNDLVDKGTLAFKAAKDQFKSIGGGAKKVFNIGKEFVTDEVMSVVKGAGDKGVSSDSNMGMTDSTVETMTDTLKGEGLVNEEEITDKTTKKTVIEGTTSTITFDGKTFPKGLLGPMETFGGKGGSTYKDDDTMARLGNIINVVSPPRLDKPNTLVIAPENKPNTSEAILKSTTTSIPFIKTVKNQYLSTNPNTSKLPPEIARMLQ